jgi:hypothetical protein
VLGRAAVGTVISPRVSFWIAVLLMGSFLAPSEAAVKVGLVLTSLRFALLAILVCGFVALIHKVSRGSYVAVMSDCAIVALVFWMELALTATHGPEAIASAVGLRPIEFLSAYLAGRCFFGFRAGLDAFLKVLLVIVALLVLMGLIDIAAGENIFGRLARQTFGIDRNSLYITQYRMGLPRARASFEHAILYGTFFSVCAPLFYFLLRNWILRLIAVCLCFLGVALSLSSAPMLSFGIFASIAVFDRLLSRAPWRWTALSCLVLFGLALLLLLVESPLRALINVLTLDPQTGLYRFLIWEWVAYNLQSSPWFGIGTRDWVRLSTMVVSVDALWLGQALHAGYVGVGLLALAIISAFFVWTPSGTIRNDDPWQDKARKAVTIALFQMIFVSFTVHYWGFCWAFLALLVGILAGLMEGRYLRSGLGALSGPGRNGFVRSLLPRPSPFGGGGSPRHVERQPSAVPSRIGPRPAMPELVGPQSRLDPSGTASVRRSSRVDVGDAEGQVLATTGGALNA